jgi:hypothetical protein
MTRPILYAALIVTLHVLVAQAFVADVDLMLVGLQWVGGCLVLFAFAAIPAVCCVRLTGSREVARG